MITPAPTAIPQPDIPSSLRPRRAAVGELAEYFQSLCHTLLSPPSGVARFVGVTSCTRGEGVSTVAVNLARAAAELKPGRVLLVDANPGSPAVERACGVNLSPGWCELLTESEPVENCIQFSNEGDLAVIAAGRRKGPPLAHSAETIDHLLHELAQNFEVIIFDLPPVKELGASLGLAGRLGGLLLVVEAERMRSQAVQRVRQQLEQARINILGVVLNKRKLHLPEWLYRRL